MKPDLGRGLIDGSATAVFNDPVGAMLRAIGPPEGKQGLAGWGNQAFHASAAEFVLPKDQDRCRELVWFKERS